MKEREIERWWRWWGGGKWVVGEEERDCKRWVWKCWSSWRFQPLLFLSTLGVRVLMREFSLPEIFVAERHTHRPHKLVNSSTFFFCEWVSECACVRALCFVSVSWHKKALLYYALSLSISFSGFIQKGKQRKKVKRYFFIWVDNDVVGVGVVVFLLFT